MQTGHKPLPKPYANRPILPAKLPSQRAKPQTIPSRHTQARQDVPTGLLMMGWPRWRWRGRRKKGFNGINQVFKNTEGHDAAEGSAATGYTPSQIYLPPSYHFPILLYLFLLFFPFSTMLIREINSLSPYVLFSTKQNFWQTKCFIASWKQNHLYNEGFPWHCTNK